MKNIDKIFFSMLTWGLLAFFVSCSEDEGSEVPTSNQIIGTWTLESAEIILTVEGKSFKEFYMETKGATAQEAEEAEEFWKASDIKSDGSLEFKANNQYQMNEPGKNPITGIWELAEDEKHLFIDGKSYEIRSFSNSKMTLYTTVSYKFDFDNNGIQDKVLNEITQHLKK